MDIQLFAAVTHLNIIHITLIHNILILSFQTIFIFSFFLTKEQFDYIIKLTSERNYHTFSSTKNITPHKTHTCSKSNVNYFIFYTYYTCIHNKNRYRYSKVDPPKHDKNNNKTQQHRQVSQL